MKKIVTGRIASGLVCLAGIYFLGHLACNNAKRENLEREALFNQSNQPMIVEVLEESYKNTLSPVAERNGLVSYSNETVKLDSNYTLKCLTEDGRTIGLSIIDAGTITKESLDQLIEKGTKISFPKGNYASIGPMWSSFLNENEIRELYDETYFKEDTQVGTKRADRIKVLQ